MNRHRTSRLDDIYTHEEALYMDAVGNRIVKQSTEKPNDESIRYAYKSLDGRVQGYMKGYHEKTTVFHIERIENNSKMSGLSYFPQIYAFMREDLKREGVNMLSVTALVRIASILEKKYGFMTRDGTPINDIYENSWLGRKILKLPYVAVPLWKTI